MEKFSVVMVDGSVVAVVDGSNGGACVEELPVESPRLPVKKGLLDSCLVVCLAVVMLPGYLAVVKLPV